MRAAIVGAGVAGSITALLLRREGFEVDVYDMSAGYVKPCGEVAPTSLLEALDSHGIPAPRVLGWIDGFTFIVGGRIIRYRFGDPVWFSMDKHGWVDRLRGLVGGARRKAIRDTSDLLGRYEIVVDARGPFSSRGLRIPVWRAYQDNPGIEDAVFVFDRSLAGFAWAFPHGDSLNIGGGFIGVDKPRGRSVELLRQASKLLGLGEALGEGLRAESHSLITILPRVDLGSPRAPRVGEAAGFIYAPGGEGIRPAALSAIALAEAYGRAGGNAERGYEEYWRLTRRLRVEVKTAKLMLIAALSLASKVDPYKVFARAPGWMVREWLSGRLYNARRLIELVQALAGLGVAGGVSGITGRAQQL